MSTSDDLRAQADKLNCIAADMTERLATAQGKATELQARAETAEAERDEARAEVERLKEELRDVRGTCLGYALQATAAEQCRDAAEQERDKAATMFRSVDEEGDKYRRDIEALKAELDGVRAENERLEEIRHEDSAEIQVLLDRIESLKANRDDARRLESIRVRLQVEVDRLLEAREDDRRFWLDRWKEAADQRDQYHADLDRLQRATGRT